MARYTTTINPSNGTFTTPNTSTVSDYRYDAIGDQYSQYWQYDPNLYQDQLTHITDVYSKLRQHEGTEIHEDPTVRRRLNRGRDTGAVLSEIINAQ